MSIRLIVVGEGKAVTKVKLSGVTILAPGETQTLKAKLSPKKPTYKEVFWRSADPSIATVEENGRVTAVGVGTATITATTPDGVKATGKIVVKK